MPERIATAKPTVMVGSPISGSLGPNTGQICMTFGGQRSFGKLSGTAGGAATIWTGAGRLDAVHVHPPSVPTLANGSDIMSGIPLVFFDSTTPGSGAPLSGEIQLWKGTGTTQPVAGSGVFRYGAVVQMGFPFLSGLSHSSISGQDGFTVYFTPVVSGTGPG